MFLHGTEVVRIANKTGLGPVKIGDTCIVVSCDGNTIDVTNDKLKKLNFSGNGTACYSIEEFVHNSKLGKVL